LLRARVRDCSVSLRDYVRRRPKGRGSAAPQGADVERPTEICQRIAVLAERDQILLPVSTAHLVEIAKKGDRQRTDVSQVMLKLSKGWQMRSPQHMETEELRGTFGSPTRGLSKCEPADRRLVGRSSTRGRDGTDPFGCRRQRVPDGGWRAVSRWGSGSRASRSSTAPWSPPTGDIGGDGVRVGVGREVVPHGDGEPAGGLRCRRRAPRTGWAGRTPRLVVCRSDSSPRTVNVSSVPLRTRSMVSMTRLSSSVSGSSTVYWLPGSVIWSSSSRRSRSSWRTCSARSSMPGSGTCCTC
jgi:hypothetical protein